MVVVVLGEISHTNGTILGSGNDSVLHLNARYSVK